MKKKLSLIALIVTLSAVLCFGALAACKSGPDDYAITTWLNKVTEQIENAQDKTSYTLSDVVSYQDEYGNEVTCNVIWEADSGVTIEKGLVTVPDGLTSYILKGTLIDKKGNPYDVAGNPVVKSVTVTPPKTEQVALTLNLNYEGAQSTTEMLDKGATYALTTPTRDGYTFDGWFTSATGGTQWTNDKPVTGNTTLYAHWTEVAVQPDPEVALVLTPNYDDMPPMVVPLKSGDTYKLLSLTRDGYTFDGWYDVLGNKYTDEITVKENTVLIARWTEKTSQPTLAILTLDLNYASQTPGIYMVNKGSTYDLPTPSRSGYTFDGWFTSPTGGTQYTSSTPINTDTALYAHWTAVTQPEPATVKEQFLSQVVTNPTVNTTYYLAMYYGLPDAVYYATSTVTSYKIDSTTNVSGAAAATIETTSGGYWLKLGGKYVNITTRTSGTKTYYNISLDATASTVYTIDSNGVLLGAVSNDTYYIGTYYNGTSTDLYESMGANWSGHLTSEGNEIDVNQFPARLISVDSGTITPTPTPTPDTGSVTIDLTGKGSSGNGVDFTAITQGAVTLDASQGTNTSNAPSYFPEGLRLYGSNTLTITVESGKTIKSIVLTYGSNDRANTISVDVGSFSTDTWTGSAGSVTFTVAGTSGHRRIATITIIYE